MEYVMKMKDISDKLVQKNMSVSSQRQAYALIDFNIFSQWRTACRIQNKERRTSDGTDRASTKNDGSRG